MGTRPGISDFLRSLYKPTQEQPCHNIKDKLATWRAVKTQYKQSARVTAFTPLLAFFFFAKALGNTNVTPQTEEHARASRHACSYQTGK